MEEKKEIDQKTHPKKSKEGSQKGYEKRNPAASSEEWRGNLMVPEYMMPWNRGSSSSWCMLNSTLLCNWSK